MKTKKTPKQITEGLQFEDLMGLVDSTIMIDMHRPKIGSDEDTVVVAFEVTYEDPANDLSSFIETGAINHLDVEVSSTPDETGNWKVFVEFQRDLKLYDKISSMLNSVDQITSQEGGWNYRAFSVKKIQKFNEENFKRDIISSRYEYRKKFMNKNQTLSDTELEEGWMNRIIELQKSNNA